MEGESNSIQVLWLLGKNVTVQKALAIANAKSLKVISSHEKPPAAAALIFIEDTLLNGIC